MSPDRHGREVKPAHVVNLADQLDNEALADGALQNGGKRTRRRKNGNKKKKTKTKRRKTLKKRRKTLKKRRKTRRRKGVCKLHGGKSCGCKLF